MPVALILCVAPGLGAPFFGPGRAQAQQAPSPIRATPLQLVLDGVPFALPLHREIAKRPWPHALDIELIGTAVLGGKKVVLTQRHVPSLEELSTASIDVRGFRLQGLGVHRIRVAINGQPRAAFSVRVVPGWLAVVPVLLVIFLALTIRRVFIAMALGALSGVWIIEGYRPISALQRLAEDYIVGAVGNRDHATVLVLMMLLGGFVGVVGRSGGASGLAGLIVRSRWMRARASLSVWLSGCVLFFDDYASTLFTGTALRPVTDRLRISREKLAFLVDATSAPVASVALISSWTAVEVGYIAQACRRLNLGSTEPYLVFLQSLPYRFYPWSMLLFTLLIALSRRDFGPMRIAEARTQRQRRRTPGGLEASRDLYSSAQRPPRRGDWLNVAVPLLGLVATLAVGIVSNGTRNLNEMRALAQAERQQAQAVIDQGLRAVNTGALARAIRQRQAADIRLEELHKGARSVLAYADTMRVLVGATATSLLIALAIVLVRRSLSMSEALDACLRGMRSMFMATVLLVLAWSLGLVCTDIHIGSLLTHTLLVDVPASLLPALVFFLAALVSFSLGGAWSTMALLFPMVLPLAVELGTDPTVVLATIAAVLSGSVWGDHCSPTSDTSIMSSIASGCAHHDHVKTQLPYALAVGAISLICGDLMVGLGVYSAWVGLGVCAVAVVLLLWLAGSPPSKSVAV